MGIQGLYDLVKGLANTNKEICFSVGYDAFNGKKIAVDAYFIMYLIKASVLKKFIEESQNDFVDENPNEKEIGFKWIKSIVDLVNEFVYNGITSIFCFDGEHSIEKLKCKEKRKSQKISIKDKIEECRSAIKADRLRISPDVYSKLKNYLCNFVYVSEEQVNILKYILKTLGVPVLNSKDEGEKLCVMLCREKKVHAVLSKDSDCLTYGCKLLITEFGGRRFKCIRLDYILRDLDYSIEKFVDYCISLGCDYNKNIFRVGPKKSKELIDQHHSIDLFPEKYDITSLNHCNCRHHFATVNSETICKNKIILEYSRREEFDYDYIDHLNLSGIEGLFTENDILETYLCCKRINIPWTDKLKETDDYNPRCLLGNSKIRDHKCNIQE